ncbi:MAG TPA: acylphosphatase [Thermoanaerobaculia bacterium]|nr:acylphosphatase [Thermoanaerobaculia bacterium]
MLHEHGGGGEPRQRIEVRGTVQGVGFRPWIYRLAREEGVGGGSGTMRRGWRSRLSGLRRPGCLRPAAADGSSSGGRDPRDPAQDDSGRGRHGAGDRAQRAGGEARTVSIPPDLATCPECLREIFDPADRRYMRSGNSSSKGFTMLA